MLWAERRDPVRTTSEVLAEEGREDQFVRAYPNGNDNCSPQQLFDPSPEF